MSEFMGLDSRRLRCQAGRVRAGRGEPAQLDDAARPRSGGVRRARECDGTRTRAHRRHAGVHVRVALRDRTDARTHSKRRRCSATTPSAGGVSSRTFAAEVDPEAADSIRPRRRHAMETATHAP